MSTTIDRTSSDELVETQKFIQGKMELMRRMVPNPRDRERGYTNQAMIDVRADIIFHCNVSLTAHELSAAVNESKILLEEKNKEIDEYRQYKNTLRESKDKSISLITTLTSGIARALLNISIVKIPALIARLTSGVAHALLNTPMVKNTVKKQPSLTALEQEQHILFFTHNFLRDALLGKDGRFPL